MQSKKRAHRVTVYQAHTGLWYWQRRASNGRIIGDSAEGYTKRAHAVKMALEANRGPICLEILQDGKRV